MVIPRNVNSGSGERGRRLFGVLVLGMIAASIAMLSTGNTFYFADAPGHEMVGTIDVTVETAPVTHWSGSAICSRSSPDGGITDVRASSVGTLQGARVWSVLVLDVPNDVVLALGQAAPGTPPFDPTTEYGGVVADHLVHQAPDRATGTIRFRLPLVIGDAFSLSGADLPDRLVRVDVRRAVGLQHACDVGELTRAV